jgi:hypothetical protein
LSSSCNFENGFGSAAHGDRVNGMSEEYIELWRVLEKVMLVYYCFLLYYYSGD